MNKSVAATCALIFISTIAVLATAPQLTAITPAGGQRGTDVEVSFLGARLDDTEEIIQYEPGWNVVEILSRTNKAVVARIRIAPDCRLGEHCLRLRTRSGITELRTFFVGPFPAVAEKEPNNEPSQAQEVALNSTVTGVVSREDVDCFTVKASKGQRISAEVEGIRLGRSDIDVRLTVLHADGAVLADVDDTWLALQDPFVTFEVPQDGTYVLHLREATYGGNNNCEYRLHVGEFPRPCSVYPPGGPAGEKLHLQFLTEGASRLPQRVSLPNAPSEKYGVFAEAHGKVAPSPNWIRVSPFPNVLELPPNQDRAHATVAGRPLPLAFNGVISQPGEEDWFQFEAVKGQALEVSVFARALRSPLDSTVQILDAGGKSLAANDDSGGPDSTLKFTPAASTNHFLRVRDAMGRGGPQFTYRVEVLPVRPRLELSIPEVARNDTQSRQWIAVARGNRFATLISARRANFGGELDFVRNDLPPGVALHADRMAASISTMPLVFEAAPDAPIGGRLLDLAATWTNQDRQVTGHFRNDIELVRGPNNTSFYGTSVDRIYVAVVQEVPFRLRIVEPKVPLVQSGSMRLQIVAERAPGFEEPIYVRMVWNPPGVSSQSEATIAKDATNVFYQLNANGGAATRAWKMAVLGRAKVDGGDVYVSSQLANLEVATPFLSGKIETLWINPGESGQLSVNLEQAKPFTGKATGRLYGLPDKVSATERNITKDDQEVVFEVTADPQCRVGSYRNVFCAVDVTENGEVIPHTIAQGGILRVVPPKDEELKVAEKK